LHLLVFLEYFLLDVFVVIEVLDGKIIQFQLNCSFFIRELNFKVLNRLCEYFDKLVQNHLLGFFSNFLKACTNGFNLFPYVLSDHLNFRKVALGCFLSFNEFSQKLNLHHCNLLEIWVQKVLFDYPLAEVTILLAQVDEYRLD